MRRLHNAQSGYLYDHYRFHAIYELDLVGVSLLGTSISVLVGCKRKKEAGHYKDDRKLHNDEQTGGRRYLEEQRGNQQNTEPMSEMKWLIVQLDCKCKSVIYESDTKQPTTRDERVLNAQLGLISGTERWLCHNSQS
jgi:hypothetical protein